MNFKNPTKFEIFIYKLSKIFLYNFYKDYVEKMNLNGNENIFEFGYGIGTMSIHLAQAISVGKLYCLDTSAVMINETKKNLKKYPNVTYINSEIKDADLKTIISMLLLCILSCMILKKRKEKRL